MGTSYSDPAYSQAAADLLAMMQGGAPTGIFTNPAIAAPGSVIATNYGQVDPLTTFYQTQPSSCYDARGNYICGPVPTPVANQQIAWEQQNPAYLPPVAVITDPAVSTVQIDTGFQNPYQVQTLDSYLRQWAAQTGGQTTVGLAAQGIHSQGDLVQAMTADAQVYCAETFGAVPDCANLAGVVSNVSKLFSNVNWNPILAPIVAVPSQPIVTVPTQPVTGGSTTPTNAAAQVNPAQPNRVNPTTTVTQTADTHASVPGIVTRGNVSANNRVLVQVSDPAQTQPSAPVQQGTSQAQLFTSGNLVTAAALTAWMQQAVGRPVATIDEWCYAMSALVTGGIICPDWNLTPYGNDQRANNMTSQQFLSILRAQDASTTQTGGVAVPGGTQVGAPTGTAAGALAQRNAASSTGKLGVIAVVAAVGFLLWRSR